jgi:dipeptidase E
MKLLLTSSGISNTSIHNALIELLGKPIAECNALFVPTAIYPFPNGAYMAWRAMCSNSPSSLCQLGWKSLGLLELTALPSIDKKAWLTTVEETDALLFWGGDPVYLAYWLQKSGLAELLPSLLNKVVYVGVSAGSMAASATFGETYRDTPAGIGNTLKFTDVEFDTPEGKISRTLVVASGAALVDFAIIPHLDNKNHPDATVANAEKWAAMLPVPAYAIDDQTAIKVNGNDIEVVSEGGWKLFTR